MSKLSKSDKLFLTFAMLLLCGIIGAVAEEADRRKRYRKVIKKGILWDSEEWHER